MRDEAAAMDWAKNLLLVLSNTNTMNKSPECYRDEVRGSRALDIGTFAFLLSVTVLREAEPWLASQKSANKVF